MGGHDDPHAHPEAGTVFGHFVPSMILMAAGYWWLYNTLKNYFEAERSSPRKRFVTRASYPGDKTWRGKPIHLEGIFCTVFIGIDMIIEIYSSTRDPPPGRWVWPGTAQHIAMTGSGFLRGIVTLLSFHTSWLPDEMDRWMTGVSFMLQWPLLYSHASHKGPSDRLIHEFTLLCWVVTGACFFVEGIFKDKVILPLLRCFSLVIGTFWFLHGGGILMHMHPFVDHHFEMDLHDQLFFVASYFVWDALFIISTFIFMSWFVQRSYPLETHPYSRANGDCSAKEWETEELYPTDSEEIDFYTKKLPA